MNIKDEYSNDKHSSESENESEYTHISNSVYAEVKAEAEGEKTTESKIMNVCEESSYGKYVVVIIYFIIAILIIILSLKTLVKNVRQSKPNEDISFFEGLKISKDKWFAEISDDYTINYKKNFEHSLVTAKGSLILILGLITLLYQFKYSNVANAKTFFGNSKYRKRALIDMGVTTFFGMLSSSIVIWSRGGNYMRNIENVCIIGIVLALFNLAQEASGLNRYLAKTDTLNKIGPYYEIDVKSNVDKLVPQTLPKGNKTIRNNEINRLSKEIETSEVNGDPFIISLSNVTALLLIIFVLYLVIKMFTATYYGYKAGINSPFAESNTIKIPFMVELIFIVAGFNIIPPLISPYIRNQKFTKISGITVVGVFIIVCVLQIMLQYTGILNFKSQ
jgi:hypothetical protein